MTEDDTLEDEDVAVSTRLFLATMQNVAEQEEDSGPESVALNC